MRTPQMFDATNQVAVRDLRLEHVADAEVGIGVVVAVNESNDHLAKDRRKLDLERPLWLDVAEQHDGIQLLALDGAMICRK